jgi:hypothetical protein
MLAFSLVNSGTNSCGKFSDSMAWLRSRDPTQLSPEAWHAQRIHHHPLQFLQTGCQYDLMNLLLKPFKPYDQAPHVVVLDSNWFGILLQHLGK